MTDRDSNKPLDTSRRNFLKQSIALAGAVSGIAALGLSAPASLRSAAWADGLVEVLEERSYAEGDVLRFIPLSEVLG